MEGENRCSFEFSILNLEQLLFIHVHVYQYPSILSSNAKIAYYGYRRCEQLVSYYQRNDIKI